MLRKLTLVTLLFGPVFWGKVQPCLATASVGNASVSVYAGGNPIDDFPRATLLYKSLDTENVVVVDDMESYDDDAVPPQHPIQYYDDNGGTWVDGWTNGSGSSVYLEWGYNAIVHSGAKSMMFEYVDDWYEHEKYAEIYRTYNDPCDWTWQRTRFWGLFFYGQADNVANDTEQMYVGLDDTSSNYGEVRYGDNGEDMNDIKVEEWQEWVIDLQEFADDGVDLTDVNRIYMGFGDREDPQLSGSGVVFLDDLRRLTRDVQDICVRLPGMTQSYVLNRPQGLLPGWSASIDDPNTYTVTVRSPDGLTYIYPEDCNHMLIWIKDANDANLAIFDYNSTTGLIDKQTDGFDSNLYIEYDYNDTTGYLDKLTLWDKNTNDSRQYTIIYDTNGNAVAATGSCSSCGGDGGYRYEYDDAGNLRRVKDANEDIVYEYNYNAYDYITDKYLGEASEGNYVQQLIYHSHAGAGYFVDIRDYVDVNSYRVTREYRDSTGRVTRRIRHENLNEDPDDPIGATFIEQTVCFYDVNNVLVKKVVIPPTGDTNDPPDPNTGIRKQYVYDPNAGKLLTETWFDVNDVNFTVSAYTYDYITDAQGNIINVRVDSYTDARLATTNYYYDGNDVDPNLKVMPEVTTGISGTTQLKYEYEYDPNRNWITLEKLLDESDNVIVQTKYVYDNNGNQRQRHDDYGGADEVTQYKYNAFNEMVRMKLPSGVVQGWSYNENGRLESEFVLAHASDINVDEPNLLSQTKYFYDDNGRLFKTARAVDTAEFVFGSPEGGWVWTQYEYDLQGNRTKVIEDVNGLSLETSYAYNNQGEVITVTLPNGKWTETYRDGRGLVIMTEVGYGDTSVAVTEFEYDANGNLEWEIAPNGTRTKYEYDDFDRVIKVTRGL